MRELKLYWSTSLQNGRKNFGDWLSPVLCEALSGMRIVHARPNKCDLMALGSILSKAKNHFWNRRIHIWGSGLIQSVKPFDSPHHIHAVRGWRTAACLRNQRPAVVGDPGLLCGILLPPGSVGHKKWRVGLIPHYVDQANPLIRHFADKPGVKIIDVFAETLNFIRDVAACEVILSSSLHGLITADALSVPNAWMRLSDQVWGEDFKYHDYYSIYGIEDVRPFPFNAGTEVADVLKVADDYRRPGLEDRQQALEQAFPFQRGRV